MRGKIFVVLIAGLMCGLFSRPSFSSDTADIGIHEQQNLIPDDWASAIEDFISTLDIKAKVSADWSGDDISAGIYFQRRMQPSYRRGFTLLTDEYVFDLSLHPRATQKTSGDVSFGLGLNTALRMVFARQFEGQSAADLGRIFLKIPYTPLQHLPWNAETAKQRMQQGDFIAVQGDMNLVGSLSQFKTLATHFPFSIGVYAIVGGQFQVHVYRLSENLFRLKVIGVGSEKGGGVLSLGFDPGNLIDDWPLKSLIAKRLKFTAVDFSVSYGWENLVLFDYLLDFDSLEVRHAYDSFMKSLLTLDTLKLARPGSYEQEVQANLVNIADFDRIFDREKGKSSGVRSVDRMFKGTNRSSGPEMNLRFGLKSLIELSYGGKKRGNFLSATDGSGSVRHFYLPAESRHSRWRLFFGALDEEWWQTSMFLFEADEREEIGDRGELTLYTDYRDARLDPHEIRDLQNMIRKNVPEDVYNEIEWGSWAHGDHSRISGRVTTLMILRPEAFEGIVGLRSQDFYQRLLSYAHSLPELRSPSANTVNYEQPMFGDPLEEYYKHDFQTISKAFAKAFDPKQEGKTRADAILNLRQIPVFQEIGNGFIADLVGRESLSENMYFETTWSARDSDTIHFIHGSCRGRRLYQAILNIYAILNDRALDMRLIDDVDIPELPDKVKNPDCE